MLALKTLLHLGTGPEAASLGPSWWVLLRAVSALEALQASMQMQHIANLDAQALSPAELAFAQVRTLLPDIVTSH